MTGEAPQGDGTRITYHLLDALRGVAALMVVLFHGAGLIGAPLSAGGYLAVDLFFALSGFVIAHAYEKRLREGMTVRRFYVMRMVRFWPLYALGLVIGLAGSIGLILTNNDYAMRPAALGLTLLLGFALLPAPQAARNYQLFPLNIPSWSLFMELSVNLLYALALPRLTSRVLAAVAAVSAVPLVLLCWQYGSGDMGAQVGTLPGGIARTIFSFSMGVLIFRLGWRGLRLPAPILLLAAVATLAAPVPSSFRVFYDLGFILIVSPILVVGGASGCPGPKMTALYRKLGAISYAIYAVHRPLIALAVPATKHLQVSPVMMAPLVIAAAVAIGLVLESWYDRPFRQHLSILFASRPGQPRAEASPV
jgi:peptidoglycan/LPS O-acetylase OafA/YrhL